MLYKHQTFDGKSIDLPVGKVVCVGQNYADHIAEMNSNVDPEQAMLFMKPNTAIVPLSPSFTTPKNLGQCHNETELAVLIQAPLSKVEASQVPQAIWGYGIAQDLTLRDVQAKAKKMGKPWERAKSFDGSCPLSTFIAKQDFVDPQACSIALEVNGEIRQQGNTSHMIRSIVNLIAEISQQFTLLPGDVVITGTPAGVGALHSGDQLIVTLAEQYQFVTQVE
ncbi:fumarylacetoacetate hydrolase family protein [Saccharobesus litoralis]|uniref:Fumarylacetoacetate hydrolase family protein n=1 Tax=Saccharobesus litoralis TaxID=2172099 RepID=A0A2S0VUP5_9ALTE|nr:fumarylacetoacetate hydrolase family protein [Saccharobesus litoralis]AWB67928.1 fumarylacetoacetate hydrolase family protein [Saccharobesus litoralis]